MLPPVLKSKEQPGARREVDISQIRNPVPYTRIAVGGGKGKPVDSSSYAWDDSIHLSILKELVADPEVTWHKYLMFYCLPVYYAK